MKFIFTSFIFFFSLASFSQSHQTQFIEVSFHVPWKKVTITLAKGSSEIYSSSPDSSTVFIYRDLEPGIYKLSITDGKSTEVRDSISVKNGQMINASISLGATCLYDYSNDYVPVCPADNRNEIQEIRYLNEKERDKGKKYHLVNYTASGCIPRYYCLEHRIKF